ncbi:hypothetical protein G9A89_009708 [Geosiphon pyriformis]|nr:hypothetical protein G9A89_009708 [Geosiphon pyriformis]
MDPKDKEKMAFTTQDRNFEFNMMPFELCNASTTFQCLMDVVYKKILWKSVIVYLDNTNVFLEIFNKYLFYLQQKKQQIYTIGLQCIRISSNMFLIVTYASEEKEPE